MEGRTLHVDFAMLEVREVHPHEEIREPLLRSLIAQLRKDRRLRRPLLVDRANHVILDGHHRYAALKALGCRKVPVYLIDYDDPGVTLTTWPEAQIRHVTKEQVIEHGRREDLFPPKTTRHILPWEVEDRPIPIDELR